MRSRIQGVINDGLGLQGMIDLQHEMRGTVQGILDGGWDKLNNYYKAAGY